MTAPVQLPNSVSEAYDLATMTGQSHGQALQAAAQAAVRASEQEIIERTVAGLGEHLSSLEDNTEDNPDTVTHYIDALQWIQEKLLETLPSSSSSQIYTPADNDVVEVVIRGEVSIDTFSCAHCTGLNMSSWTLETGTGDVYAFHMDSDIEVRKIAGR